MGDDIVVQTGFCYCIWDCEFQNASKKLSCQNGDDRNEIKSNKKIGPTYMYVDGGFEKGDDRIEAIDVLWNGFVEIFKLNREQNDDYHYYGVDDHNDDGRSHGINGMIDDDTNATGKVVCGFNHKVFTITFPESSSVFFSSFVGLLINTATIMYTIKAKRASLELGDSDSAMSFIIPVLLPILYIFVAVNFIQICVVIAFSFLCNKTYVDMNSKDSQINVFLYTLYWFSYDLCSVFILLIFFYKSVSYKVYYKCMGISTIISTLSSTLAQVGMRYEKYGGDWKRAFEYTMNLGALSIPLFGVVIPLMITIERRRPSCRVVVYYSFCWRLAFCITYLLGLINHSSLSNPHTHPTSTFVIVVLLIARNSLLPLVVYHTLIADTQYWRGLLLSRNHHKNHNGLDRPRYAPGDNASEQLQNLLQEVDKDIVDFAFLDVNYSKLLGRGSSATVFHGTLTVGGRKDMSRSRQTWNRSEYEQKRKSASVANISRSSSASSILLSMSMSMAAPLTLNLPNSDNNQISDELHQGLLNGNSTSPPTSPSIASPMSASKRSVAIKFLTPPELNVETIESVANETKILSELTPHVNLVHYFGIAVLPPHICMFLSFSSLEGLVFECCEGGGLSDAIERNENWTPLKKLLIARDCIRSVVYLHSKNVIHRDIKSENYLLVYKQEDIIDEWSDGIDIELTRCVLADFGSCVYVTQLERENGEGFMNADVEVGTVENMASELIASRKTYKYTKSTDVYALAVVVASILSMSQPWNTSMKASEIRQSVLSGKKPHAFSSVIDNPDKDWSSALCISLDAALSNHSQERPTASELLGVIETSINERRSALPQVFSSPKFNSNFPSFGIGIPALPFTLTQAQIPSPTQLN